MMYDFSQYLPKNRDATRQEIRAMMLLAGLTYRELSKKHGLSQDSLRTALNAKWPKGERIIASALGLSPEQLWPSRYRG